MPLPKIRVRIWHVAVLVALVALGIGVARLAQLSRIYARKSAEYAAREHRVTNMIRVVEAQLEYQLATLDAERRKLETSRRETVAEWWIRKGEEGREFYDSLSPEERSDFLATLSPDERRHFIMSLPPTERRLIETPPTPAQQREYEAMMRPLKAEEEKIAAWHVDAMEINVKSAQEKVKRLSSAAEHHRAAKEKYQYLSLHPWEAVPPAPP